MLAQRPPNRILHQMAAGITEDVAHALLDARPERQGGAEMLVPYPRGATEQVVVQAKPRMSVNSQSMPLAAEHRRLGGELAPPGAR